MQRLSADEFRDALRKGKGRAVLHVKRFGDEGVRNAILEICTKDTRYDSQLEDDRHEWLYGILEATGHPERYLPGILRALGRVKEPHRLEYLFDMAAQFAIRGNMSASNAIRRKYLGLPPEKPTVGLTAMVNARGMEGFIESIEKNGAVLLDEEDWLTMCCLKSAAEKIGEEEVFLLLRQRSKGNPEIAAFLRKFRKFQRIENKPFKRPSVPTLRQLVLSIRKSEHGDWRRRKSLFAKFANRADLRKLFDIMLAESDPKLICRYLEVFWRRLPWIHPKLFDWARSRNSDLHRCAMVALSKAKGAPVREFAIERLRREKPDWWGLGLLERNYRKGDGKWLLEISPKHEKEYVLHAIGLELNDIAELNRDASLVPCLRWTYENTPCSMCRARAFERLIWWKRAPAAMLREALHDAVGSTREAARKALRTSKKNKT